MRICKSVDLLLQIKIGQKYFWDKFVVKIMILQGVVSILVHDLK